MIPCVYYVGADRRTAVFFCSATTLDRAVVIATSLRSALSAFAPRPHAVWVADWQQVAHQPTAVERAMHAIGDVPRTDGFVKVS